MRIPNPHIMALTLAMRHPDTVAAAVEHLHGATGQAEVEGLVELLYEPPSARVAVAAIEALGQAHQPIVVDALRNALKSEHNTVRQTAVRALQLRGAECARPDLVRLLREDSSWLIRRTALWAVADFPEPEHWQILSAQDDPHWRVRHALIKVLLRWGDSDEARREIVQHLTRSDDPRALGIIHYLEFRFTGKQRQAIASAVNPLDSSPFWDWDPAVMLANLECMDEDEIDDAIGAAPLLLQHDDERIRRRAVEMLLKYGEAPQLASAVALLNEPRGVWREDVQTLLTTLDMDRREDTARLILHDGEAQPGALAWAVDQAGEIFPIGEENRVLRELMQQQSAQPPAIAAALARLAKRWHQEVSPISPETKNEITLDEQHPHVRARELTPERAAELLAEPTRETSWHVLAEAARIMRVPLWEIEPEDPWRAAAKPQAATDRSAAAIEIISKPQIVIPFGPQKTLVSRMAISGAYGLSHDGFAHALANGINLLFWEPTYNTLTSFYRRLSPTQRTSLHLITGTFNADEKRIRQDVERALRQLRIERISFFLLFWVRSQKRIAGEIRDILQTLQKEGKIAVFGLSTHDRELAMTALESRWNPVMVRHSAAHPGAEAKIFPKAVEMGTSLITFNNTCYGRLLHSPNGHPAPTAVDCYRYTLNQPGVSVCLSAPATVPQLKENLTALGEPELPQERRQFLVECGESVYREDTVFRKLVRVDSANSIL